jgi:ActR/RegA family two-component response regulator
MRRYRGVMPKDKPLAVLLDDDLSFRILIDRVLERRGFEVRSFHEKEAFLEQFRPHSPEIAFVDLNIDQTGDGLSVVKCLRTKLNTKIPVLMISGISRTVAFDYAMKSGATDYLVKPISHHILNHKLSQYVPTPENVYPEDSLLPSVCLGETVDVITDFNLTEIDELGVRFTANHLLSRNAELWIQSKVFEEITGSSDSRKISLTNIELSPFQGLYEYRALFDSQDIRFLSSVRRWLAQNVK